MLTCSVKFCGGCNPRYERGEAYQMIRSQTEGVCAFSLPQEGTHYDVLLILRGCTGCPYLYEEVEADHRLIVHSEAEAEAAVAALHGLAKNTK